MSSLRAQEILYESEAALRLVDNELHRLRDGDAGEPVVSGAAEFPQVVENANVQLMAVIEQIRQSRSASARAAAQRDGANATADDTLAHIEARLLEVTQLFESSIGADNARMARGDAA